ncbi:MAG TPA: hypothetical protein DCX80_12125 [Chloroflexi bacterium]|jgi:hypothetical protein|nr:hypothetical protein [Chloroflexota bacterium]
MEDHRSSNHAVPRRARTGLDASLAESLGIDFKDLHRVRHLLGIAVGTLLAWYPASQALDLFNPFGGRNECGFMCMLFFFSVPYWVVALAFFLTGSVLTVEAINARYRRFGANAGHEKMGR